MSVTPSSDLSVVPDTAALNLRALHPDATFLRIMGVNYVHMKVQDVGVAPNATTTESNQGDLYLTEYGVPHYRHLLPENWYEPAWFEAKRVRLVGTGTVYRVPTRPLV